MKFLHMKLGAFFFVFLFTMTFAIGQNTITKKFDSEILQTDRYLKIYVPPNYAIDSTKYYYLETKRWCLLLLGASKKDFMKMVLLGEVNVGKTTLINKFCGKDGPAGPTIGPGDF